MGGARQAYIAAGILASAGMLATVPSLAQDGGLLAEFRFAESLEFSDNPDFIADPTGTTLRSRTSLGFGLSSVTANESFGLDLGAVLDYTLATSSDTPVRDGFVDPFVRFDYARSSATSRLSFAAGYSQSDVGDLRRVTDPTQGDLIVDDGEVERTFFTFGLDTGIGEPFGISLDASYSRRTYTETTDPDLNDDETFSIDARANFAIDPITTISAIAGYSRNQEFEGSVYDRETISAGVGFERQISAARTLRFDLTSDRIDTTDEDGNDVEEGYSFALDFIQVVPTGTLTFSATSQLESIGNRNSLTVERDFDLPDGELVFALGVTNNDTSDLSPIFRVNYSRELATGTISARAAQIVRQDSTSDDEFRDRILALDYAQDINSVSGWNTSFAYIDADNLTDGTDTQRIDFLIQYRRALTDDWDLVSGYRYEEFLESDADDRSANTVFLTVERDFAVRP